MDSLRDAYNIDKTKRLLGMTENQLLIFNKILDFTNDLNFNFPEIKEMNLLNGEQVVVSTSPYLKAKWTDENKYHLLDRHDAVLYPIENFYEFLFFITCNIHKIRRFRAIQEAKVG